MTEGHYWNRIWTDEKWQRAQDMRAAGKRDDQIAKALGLTEKQIATKFTNEHYANRTRQQRACEHARLNERDLRLRAAELRTQTQKFFGDPAPGFSALDKKQRTNLAEPQAISTGIKAGLSQ